jgi:Protein of unknown function (DUF4242)
MREEAARRPCTRRAQSHVGAPGDSTLWVDRYRRARVSSFIPGSGPKEAGVPKFVIERDVPGAGKLSEQELHDMSVKSNEVLNSLGPKIQWLHSYVTDDKIYCVYIAPDEESVREHARRGGFPANRVTAVRRLIDPTTGR